MTFLLAALAWSLGLFAALRLPWVEKRLVVPLTQAQKQAADYYAGSPAVPVVATLECSGTDVLALCLAAILACPVPWRARLAGSAGAVAFILALNTVRIATLGHTAASPDLFRVLHLQVWPAILVLAVAGYVFAWMRQALVRAEQPQGIGDCETALAPLVRRFAPRAAVLLVAFALCGPWIARSDTLLAAGAWLAGAAALVLAAAGLTAAATGNVLATSRGAFIVTPDCLATALVPLYVAAVFTARWTWRARAVALIAAVPLFAGLAMIRLLLLALPPALAASPLFLVHGFHQLVLAVIVGGHLTSVVLGGALALAPHAPMDLTAPGDAQGALALLPAFQAGLLLALGMAAVLGWRRLLSAFALLLASQVGFLVFAGLADRGGLVPHALFLRAWAVGVPVVLTMVMLRAGPRAPAPLRPAADGP